MQINEKMKTLLIGVATVLLAFVVAKVLRERVPAVGQYLA